MKTDPKQKRIELFKSLCTRKSSYKDAVNILDDAIFAQEFNKIVHDDRQRIDAAMVAEWRGGKLIPNMYIAYLSSFLNTTHEDLNITFSLERQVLLKEEKLAKLLREPESYEVGYFADFFIGLEEIFSFDRKELAATFNTYESVINAVADGSATPSAAFIEKFAARFKMNEVIKNHLLRRVALDISTLQEDPQKKQVARALGRVDFDSTLNDIFSDIFSVPYIFPLKEMHDEIDGFSRHVAIKLKGGIVGENGVFRIDTIRKGALGFAREGTTAFKVFEDVGLQNKPRLSGEEQLRKFIKNGGTNINGFITFLFKENRYRAMHELATATGIEIDTLRSWQTHPDTKIDYKAVKLWENYLQLKSEDDKFDLLALARGDITLGMTKPKAKEEGAQIDFTDEPEEATTGTHGKIMQAARKLLQGCTLPKKGENIVYEYLWKHDIIKHAEEINEDTVPRALFMVLLDRCGTSASHISKTSGIEFDPLMKYAKGEERIGYTQIEDRLVLRMERVRGLANYFSHTKETAADLGRLFLGIAREVPLEEFTQRVADLNSTHGRALREIRLQRLQTVGDFVEGSNVAEARCSKWENDVHCDDEDTAHAFAEFIGFDKKDPNLDCFIGSMIGTLPTISHEFFEEIVQDEFEYNTPESFGKVVRAVGEVRGFRTILELAENVTSDRSATGHVLPQAVRSWVDKGKYPQSRAIAAAIADTAEYPKEGEEIREKIISIALNKIPVFDAEIIPSLSADSSEKEKAAAFNKLIENAGKTKKDIHLKIWKDDIGMGSSIVLANVTELSRSGETLLSDPVKRKNLLSAIADEVIFGDVDEDQKTRFMEVFGKTKEQEISAGSEQNAASIT